MQVINLLVHPNAALVLIYAHAPVTHDVTAVIADIVGEFHEFFLEISKRLSVIAFSKFSNKVERVRFNAFLEILKTNAPMFASSCTGILLRNNFAFLTALANGFPFIEFDGKLLGHDVLFSGPGIFVSLAESVSDIGNARTENTVCVDEFLIDFPAVNNFANDEIQNGEVRVRFKDDDQIRQIRRA